VQTRKTEQTINLNDELDLVQVIWIICGGDPTISFNICWMLKRLWVVRGA
jgi:hypothetical protein